MLTRAQSNAIKCINTMSRCVDYCDEAVAEYEANGDDGIEKYTLRFEAEYTEQLKGTTGRDIGGLIVYLREDVPVMVYDYENFCAWDLQ